MRKLLIILIAIIGFGIRSNAQEIMPKNVKNCVMKNAFGVDIGLGGSFLGFNGNKSETLFAPALGIRVMHHFNPYFGNSLFIYSGALMHTLAFRFGCNFGE